MKKLTVAAAAAMTLAGCTGLSTTDMLGDKTLVLTPNVIDSAYKSQAVVNLYTSANVNHLILKLLDGATEKASKTISNANLAQPVTFSNLKNNKTYTVKAYAYLTADESTQISVDASSSMTITVGTDNAVNVGTIPVKLADSVFNGTGTNSIAISEGVYTYPAAENMP